jgi:hypothetical protein
MTALTTRITRGTAACGALALLLAGCASQPTIESDLGLENAPDWVNQGTALIFDDDARIFYGVDSAPPMDSLSLQRSTADDRARAEVARSLSTWMEVVAEDYAATAGSGEDALDETQVSRQIRAVSEINLTGARIIARWRDEQTGDIHSLARIRLDEVTQTLGSVQDMNSGLRDHIGQRGPSIFDRMAEGDAS